jgi:hypothetical protein
LKTETVVLDQAIRFCQQQILANRTGTNPPAITSALPTPVLTVSTTTVTTTTTTVTTAVQVSVSSSSSFKLRQ